MIILLVWEDYSGCSAEVGLERSKTEDRNFWKNQAREDSVLDQNLGIRMQPSRWIPSLFWSGVDRTC